MDEEPAGLGVQGQMPSIRQRWEEETDFHSLTPYFRFELNAANHGASSGYSSQMCRLKLPRQRSPGTVNSKHFTHANPPSQGHGRHRQSNSARTPTKPRPGLGIHPRQPQPADQNTSEVPPVIVCSRKQAPEGKVARPMDGRFKGPP